MIGCAYYKLYNCCKVKGVSEKSFLPTGLSHPIPAYIPTAGEKPAPKDGVVAIEREARAKDLALYMIEHRSTVRSAAKAFGVSKSTVHKDLQERLPAINPVLYRQVKEILEENKAERHIRGGIATRNKYRRR